MRENEEAPKYPVWKKWLCYTVAYLIVIAIVYTFSGFITSILGISKQITGFINSFITVEQDTLTRFAIVSGISVLFFTGYYAMKLGDSWRSRDIDEIGTSFISLPNFFSDPNFKKGPTLLRKQYDKLYMQYKVIKKSLNDAEEINVSLFHYFMWKETHSLLESMLGLVQNQLKRESLIKGKDLRVLYGRVKSQQ